MPDPDAPPSDPIGVTIPMQATSRPGSPSSQPPASPGADAAAPAGTSQAAATTNRFMNGFAIVVLTSAVGVWGVFAWYQFHKANTDAVQPAAGGPKESTSSMGDSAAWEVRNRSKPRVDAPASQKSTAQSSAPPLSNTARVVVVDLLHREKAGHDSLQGSWTMTSEGLWQQNPNGSAIVEFRYTPPREYDFAVEFTMKTGRLHVEQILSSDGNSFVWKQGPWFGFDPLDGRLMGFSGPRTEATATHRELRGGERHRNVIEVRQGSLRVVLDGTELLKWSGDFKRLGNAEFQLRNPDHLGLATWNSTAVFHKVEVREIQGP